ncbi:MAG TPA: hypothetical protein DHV48_10435 [Prolixibacteraceae bacterium]|nr:hypothetical protein [Prolixibacteraceae bacterium]
MKKIVVKFFAIAALAIIVFFNISLNVNSKVANVNLGQEAQAAKVCTEYYGGEELCCYSFQGSCLTSWGSYSFTNG